MTLELDIDILNKVSDITLNQLVFINLVTGENQNKVKIASQVLSLISEEEIQDLVNRELISIDSSHGYVSYEKTSKLENLIKPETNYFDEFYELFPAVVHRPDGTKGYLRANVNKCRKFYNQITGKSKAKHEHIMSCLQYEIYDKMTTGKLGYLKTMWKWLVNSEWEVSEEQMKDNNRELEAPSAYGTEII